MVTNIMLIQVVNGVSSVIVIVLVLRLFWFCRLPYNIIFTIQSYHISLVHVLE